MKEITVNDANYVEQWKNIQYDVLAPMVAEALTAQKKPTHGNWFGERSLPQNNRPIHIHNYSSPGFFELPIWVTMLSAAREPTRVVVVNNTQTMNSYYASPTAARNNGDKEEANSAKDTALMIAGAAVIAFCVGAIIYTGYEMSLAVGQYLSARRNVARVNTAMKGEAINKLPNEDLKTKLKDIVALRSECLQKAQKRKLAQIVEAITIIAGLALVAVGCATGFMVPLIAVGMTVVVASIIARFVTNQIWPNLKNDEDAKRQLTNRLKDAEELMGYKMVMKDQSPDSLYPDVEKLREELGYGIRNEKTYKPKPYIPPTQGNFAKTRAAEIQEKRKEVIENAKIEANLILESAELVHKQFIKDGLASMDQWYQRMKLESKRMKKFASELANSVEHPGLKDNLIMLYEEAYPKHKENLEAYSTRFPKIRLRVMDIIGSC